MTTGNGNGNGDHVEETEIGDRITPVDTTRREEGDELPRAQRFLAMPPHIALANLDEKIEVLTNFVTDSTEAAKKELDAFRKARMAADRSIYASIRELRDGMKEKLATELGVIQRMFDVAIDSSERARSEMATFKVDVMRVLAGIGNDGAVERAEAERDALREELEKEKAAANAANAKASALVSASEKILSSERAAAIDEARARVIESRARVMFRARLAAGVLVVVAILAKVLLS